MNVQKNPIWWIIEQVMPWSVLAILVFYSYAKFYGHPYGFRWDVEKGIILYVFDEQKPPTLEEGDKLLQIGNVLWEDFNKDLRKTFFAGIKPNDVVPIIVERDGQTLNIAWSYPGSPNQAELREQFIGEWFIAYFFWLAGAVTVILIRPRDKLWQLLVVFNFLTAIWLIVGSGVSASHIWYSALILRMAIWLCVPVYLHLHWEFPRPLGKLPPLLVWTVYGIAVVLAIAQWLQLVPGDSYLFGFLIAIGGSLILILLHLWHQPATRRDLRLPFLVFMLALIPPLIWQLLAISIGVPASLGGVALLSLPLLPLAYFYSAFRRRLGETELRVNRFFSISLFVVMLGFSFLPSTALLDQVVEFPGKPLAFAFVAAVLTAAAFIWGYPVFESFVERRIFGIPLPSKRLLEVYSTRITTSDLLSDLVRVLETEIIPSLLIRQFVFLQSNSGTLKVLSKFGVNETQIPKEQDMFDLMKQPGIYRSPDLTSNDQPHSWIRLVQPLKLGEETIGFWLFGRRDPDDIYSQLEIPILQSLASQTAIALSNILQTERLKSMYEGNIDRYEQEKLRLSRDLHDSIMNEMAALLMREEAPVFSSEFQRAFEALTERLREIVTELRPPALTFGLKTALEDLADGLSERNREKVKIAVDLQTDGEWHYPDKVESHVYRIVQEACVNALKYAHAKTIKIAGRLSRQKIELTVEDDGVGFDSESRPSLADTHSSKHYGLTGMHERASLIGAEVDIDPKLGMGTRIQVTWESKESM